MLWNRLINSGSAHHYQDHFSDKVDVTLALEVGKEGDDGLVSPGVGGRAHRRAAVGFHAWKAFFQHPAVEPPENGHA